MRKRDREGANRGRKGKEERGSSHLQARSSEEGRGQQEREEDGEERGSLSFINYVSEH